MTIQEKILAGLQQKFTGVDTAILTRIANKKAEGVTDETQVNSIVEGISFSDVLKSYGDFRAGDASITAVATYEKKHNLKDGKPVVETVTEKPTEVEPEDVPAWAKALIESNKSLSDKLTRFETEKELRAFAAEKEGLEVDLAIQIVSCREIDLSYKEA